MLDSDPTTAWVTQFDDRPVLEVRLDAPTERADRPHRRAHATGTATPDSGCRPGSPVRTDTGEVRVDVPASGRVEVPLPGGATGAVTVEVLETDEGDPGEVLTGLVAVDLDGVSATEAVVAPTDRADPADAVLLSGGLPGSDGCVQPEEAVVCYGEGGRDGEGGAVLARRFTAAGGGRLRGERDARRLAVGGRPARPRDPGRRGRRRAAAAPRPSPARPEAVVDGDERTAWSPAAGRHLADAHPDARRARRRRRP